LAGEFIPAVLLVVLGFLSKGSATVAVVLLALASAVGGASSSGSLPNIVDLSPNFAGTCKNFIYGDISHICLQNWRSRFLLTEK
jgi:hypothetical protein